MSEDIKSVLKQLQKNIGSSVNMDSLMKIAKSVDDQSMKDPESLRKLIKQIAKTADVQVSDDTVKELVQTIQKQKIGMSHIQSLLKKFGR